MYVASVRSNLKVTITISLHEWENNKEEHQCQLKHNFSLKFDKRQIEFSSHNTHYSYYTYNFTIWKGTTNCFKHRLKNEFNRIIDHDFLNPLTLLSLFI